MKKESQLGPRNLYEHVTRGHVPYLSTCQAYVRSSGKFPAHKLKHGRAKNLVATDFAYCGRLKFLVIMVAHTGMLLAGVMDGMDRDAHLRMVGMTGKEICLSSDGEPALLSLFRSAARLEASPLSGLVVASNAPNRLQQNGLAEMQFKQ